MEPARSAIASRPLASRPEPPPTHPCIRCGASVDLDSALCERCNPLGLSQPAASQAHGTILLAVVLSVAALAVVGRMAAGGIGPFTGSIAGVKPSPQGLEVTIAVDNEGSRAGSTTCRVFDPTVAGIGPDSSFLLSPEVAPGQSLRFTGLVTTLGSAPRALGVDCR